MSESEFEDDGNQVELPQQLASRGAAARTTSALRLVELGPRMALQLIKVCLTFFLIADNYETS